MKKIFLALLLFLISLTNFSQIIADHTIVDRYDDIPQYYVDSVKKMWLTVLGESHSRGYMTGLTLLESLDPRYSVNVTETGTPEPFTDAHLRASNAYWYTGINQWAYLCGEEGFWTNSTGTTRIKNSITYCNTHNLRLAAVGFGWCWDMTAENVSSGIDPTYGCHWYGRSVGGADGSRAWGLDATDYPETGNSVSLVTYLAAVEGYIEHCRTNGYSTRVYFTTGTVDIYAGEAGYQGYLKNEKIREYVRADASRILFDYADILCYDNDGTPGTTTWNGHTYPFITSANLNPTVGAIHISEAGSIRLAKAMWWMLARIAGWDGG
jgi:hypothetical protein